MVIAADDSIQLTARTLLRDILYRSKFKFRNGEEKMEYGIVWRAEKVGRHSKNLDVRIACDRISEYFQAPSNHVKGDIYAR